MSITTLVSTIATLALLLLAGYIAGKTKIVDEIATEKLSALILKIGQPFLIINSLLGVEYSRENLKIGFSIVALGLGMHAFMALVSHLISSVIKNPDERKISEHSMIFSNCGFIGFPIVNSILGPVGVFYGAFYQISSQLFSWTWGVSIFARGRDDIKLTPKKIVLNFGTIPCLIGILLFISRIELPVFLTTFSTYLANLCTPIALVISGANIARRNMKKMLSNPRIYLVNAGRLIIMPILVASTIKLLGLPDYMVIFGGIMAAMPCPSVVTMFAEMYRISPGYAAELVGSSTLISTLTIIPVVSLIQLIAGL